MLRLIFYSTQHFIMLFLICAMKIKFLIKYNVNAVKLKHVCCTEMLTKLAERRFDFKPILWNIMMLLTNS